MDRPRAARITAVISLVPIVLVAVFAGVAIEELSAGRDGGVLLFPLVVVMVGVLNAVLVYSARTRRGAWMCTVPLLVVGLPCLLFVLRTAAEFARNLS